MNILLILNQLHNHQHPINPKGQIFSKINKFSPLQSIPGNFLHPIPLKITHSIRQQKSYTRKLAPDIAHQTSCTRYHSPNSRTRLHAPDFVHQTSFTRLLAPKFLHQISLTKFAHQTSCTKVLAPKFLHQISLTKFTHQTSFTRLLAPDITHQIRAPDFQYRVYYQPSGKVSVTE